MDAGYVGLIIVLGYLLIGTIVMGVYYRIVKTLDQK